jgi:hypothetical protein
MVPMGFGLADQEENRLDNDSVESVVDGEDSVDYAQEDNAEISSVADTEENAILPEDSEAEETSENIEVINTELTEEDLIEKLSGEDATEYTADDGSTHLVAREGEDRLYLDDLTPVYARKSGEEWVYYTLATTRKKNDVPTEDIKNLTSSKNGEPVYSSPVEGIEDEDIVAYTDDKTGEYQYHEGKQVFRIDTTEEEANQELFTVGIEVTENILDEETEYYTAQNFLGENYLAKLSKHISEQPNIVVKDSDGELGETNPVKEEEPETSSPKERKTFEETIKNFTIEIRDVHIDEIRVSAISRAARHQTSLDGLNTSVSKSGVIVPIVLCKTDEWAKAEREGVESFGGKPKYIVLDGMRRLHAHNTQNGRNKKIKAYVYTFIDPIEKDLPHLVRLIQTTRKLTIQESYDVSRILNGVEGLTTEAIEHRSGLELGDYTRLLAIYAAADRYPEVLEKLLEGKYAKSDILTAYNAIVKLQKDEDQSEVENSVGESEKSLTGGSKDEVDEEEKLTAVQSLEKLGFEVENLPVPLNLAESAEEAEDINKQIQEHAAGDDSSYAEVGELQKPSDRKRLDPELKAAVIERDNYKCVSCGLLLTGSFAYASREIHHTFQVANQLEESRDTLGKASYQFDMKQDDGTTKTFVGEENILVTLCKNCHSLTHVLFTSNGKVGFTEEQFSAAPKWQKDLLKNCLYFANILEYARKKSGRKETKSYNPDQVAGPYWATAAENEKIDKVLVKKHKEASKSDVSEDGEDEAKESVDTSADPEVSANDIEKEADSIQEENNSGDGSTLSLFSDDSDNSSEEDSSATED